LSRTWDVDVDVDADVDVDVDAVVAMLAVEDIG
jgi:hypothetical protein